MNATDPKIDASTWWRSLQWPALVVALLAGHVLLLMVALLLSSTWIPGASSPPRQLVDELRWDELQELRHSSDHLGWTLAVSPYEETEINGDRRVLFTLLDDQGASITDAELRVAVYHHSRPNQPIKLAFQPDPANDERKALLDINREGSWHVSALALRGTERFFVEADFWVGNSAEGTR